MQDEPAEAQHRPLLHRDQRAVARHQLVDQRRIQRLGKARVGQRDETPFASSPARPPRLGQMRAEGQDRHVMAFLQDTALADLSTSPGLGHLDATPSPRG
jgi:hypothetical protein